MDEEREDDPHETSWLPTSHERLRAAGAELIRSIERQLELLEDEVTRMVEPSRESLSAALENAAVEYADAYIEFTGDWHPLGFLESFDDEQRDEDTDEDSPQPGDMVSVLFRADFRVSDEESILIAGRRLFQEDSGQDAETVAHAIGRGAAIYQLIHRHGLESLNSTVGLQPLGAITQVIEPDEAIGHDDEFPYLDGPNKAFATNGKLLFGSEDRWVR